MVFYVKDPSGGAISPANAKMYAEVVGKKLSDEFGADNVRDAW